jgi:hypothetical protein
MVFENRLLSAKGAIYEEKKIFWNVGAGADIRDDGCGV